MPSTHDGPRSPLFDAIRLKGNTQLSALAKAGASSELSGRLAHAPSGSCTCWGMPFEVKKIIWVKDRPHVEKVKPTRAKWLVFMHTADVAPQQPAGKIADATTLPGRPGEAVADYVICYADGTEIRLPIRMRDQIAMLIRRWGEVPYRAVGHQKPRPLQWGPNQTIRNMDWGGVRAGVSAGDLGPWTNWLWAWENPNPDKAVTAIRFEPRGWPIALFGISAGNCEGSPLRWGTRQKAILTLPKGEKPKCDVDEHGLLEQIQLDLGQVASATPQPVYPNKMWAKTDNNAPPEFGEQRVLVEYTAHPDAAFYVRGGKTVTVPNLAVVAPADQRVELRVVDDAGKPVAVKLHIHGEAGEYLAPVDRSPVVNPMWVQDFSVDFMHQWKHPCTYIDGQATISLPVGKVYIEVSKGFEIRPIRRVVRITRGTRRVTLKVRKVLPWREKGWVSADTHVHVLSPGSCLVEGAGEGVNVVNLLATQWGEMFTNVGDFDGRTLGSKQAGGDGEYLVRVGTENRQHVMGHISLLGYGGRIIAPMTVGGPDESRLGDPVDVLLLDWAKQCRKQGGIVVMPHFPWPRVEQAADIVAGEVDGVEMTSWGSLYGGIDPYSLADWYRYLNCGYLTAAVGGTDKMSADTPVGAVRTYARLRDGEEFTYESWMNAIRRAQTFVTYGPLVEFSVEGQPAGSRIKMSHTGGTVDVAWQAASVTVPMSRVELMVNGEVRESVAVSPEKAAGSWSVNLDKSSWLALLVRGHYRARPEIIAAHTSPVMVEVAESPFMSAADAVTILEQIEGALAYLDTVGTRADDRRYKQMRLQLTAAHRSLHNRMHTTGHYHKHTPADDHHRAGT